MQGLKQYSVALASAMICLTVLGCARSERRVSQASDVGRNEDGRTHDEPVYRASETNNNNGPSQRVVLTTDAGSQETYSSIPINLDEFRAHAHGKTALIVDARGPEQFASGHVRGAVNIPPSEMERYVESTLRGVDRSQLIIIYCSSASCHSSEMVDEYLRSLGFTNTRVFSQGWLTLAHAKDLR